MFPLVAIGGAIGAALSIVKGVSWLSEQLESAKTSASVGGKSEAKPLTEAQASAFETTLAAQVAGQKQPIATAALAPSPMVGPALSGPEYDTVARMKAGLIAYSNVGEHRGGHGQSPYRAGEDPPGMRA